MAFCNMCGTQIPEGSTMCAACASRAGAQAPRPASGAAAGAMSDNMAGMLAYFTIIPAIVFLLIWPYNKNRFVRFHSFQCIFFLVGVFLVHVALSIIPFMGLFTFPLHALISLGTLIVLVVCALKANQGLLYKLPVVGDMAEKQANAM